MQPHIWYYFFISTIQSEVFVQVFSLCHSVDITGQTGKTLQLIVFKNTATCLRQLNVPNLTESTISH